MNGAGPVPTTPLYILDASAPFFLPEYFKTGRTINWSKIPFAFLERNGRLPLDVCDRIEQRFGRFIAAAAAEGFNALSLDDVAHAAALPGYSARLCTKISAYQELYQRLFERARAHNLGVFLNTDIMFYAAELSGRRGNALNVNMLEAAIERLFLQFPRIAGLILRLGECDGLDVSGDFCSRLVVRKPAQANNLLRRILPLFVKSNRLMIVRTWTVGAYPIGDLIWNPKTYRTVFKGIEGSQVIVSLKFGETDFYRYLEPTPLFFEGPQNKILEIQARREYEGFGEFPAFAGYEYERYRTQLAACPLLCGIHVWCQTGGWSRFNHLTFLKQAALWNELNAVAALTIFAKGYSAERAAADFCARRLPGHDTGDFARLALLSDRLVKRLWYLPEFAEQEFYFRRVRLPPLLWIFWDTIIINGMVRCFMRTTVRNRPQAIDRARLALADINEMKSLARTLGLDGAAFDRQYALFEILALAHGYFLGNNPATDAAALGERISRFSREYPYGFTFEFNRAHRPFVYFFLAVAARLALRRRSKYRIIDRVLIIPLGGLLFLAARRWFQPRFAKGRAMGLRVIFR